MHYLETWGWSKASSGKNITHVGLTEKGWAATTKPQLDKGTVASLAAGNSAYPEKCANAQLYIQGDSYLESHQGDSNKAFASAHANCSVPEQDIPGKKEKNNNPISKINANPADFADRWKCLIIECYGDYVPPFTKKEFGQLKTFVEGCPPGQALTILDCCLRHWEDFTEYAKYNYSAFLLPARPTLDFLTKHRAAAMNFVIKEMAKKAKAVKEATIPKGVLVNPAQKTVAPTVKIFVKTKKHQGITKEEFFALMAEDYVGQGNPVPGLSAGHKKNVEQEPKEKPLTCDEMMAIDEEQYYASLNLEK